MKVLILLAIVAVVRGASPNLTRGPSTDFQQDGLVRPGGPEPGHPTGQRSSGPVSSENFRRETTGSLRNRERAYTNRDDESNIPHSSFYQRPTTFNIPSDPSRLTVQRYSSNAGIPSVTYQPLTVSRGHSVAFAAPLADTYSYIPGFPQYRSGTTFRLF